MNQKVSGFLFFGCILLFLCNHYWVDWDDYAIRKAEQNLQEVIQQQRIDLENWIQGSSSDITFRKRTLCQGRLTEWSDDRPFEYDLTVDSIGVLENDHGIFLFQTIKRAECEYLSGYPLYQYYSISNKYLKEQRGEKLTHHIKGISKEAAYPYFDLLMFDIKPRPSPILNGVIGLILVFIFIVEYVRFSQIGFSSFLVSTFVFLLLRLASLYFDALDMLFRFFLFDPINFTSSFLNPTLGDLLLNSVIVLIIVLFVVKYRSRFTGRTGRLLLLSQGIGLSLIIYHVPWSVLNNSQISLDVGESIQFTTLRITAYLAILIFSTAYFVFLFFLPQSHHVFMHSI